MDKTSKGPIGWLLTFWWNLTKKAHLHSWFGVTRYVKAFQWTNDVRRNSNSGGISQ